MKKAVAQNSLSVYEKGNKISVNYDHNALDWVWIWMTT